MRECICMLMHILSKWVKKQHKATLKMHFVTKLIVTVFKASIFFKACSCFGLLWQDLEDPTKL